MSDEVIERMARWLWANEHGGEGDKWPDSPASEQKAYRESAQDLIRMCFKPGDDLGNGLMVIHGPPIPDGIDRLFCEQAAVKMRERCAAIKLDDLPLMKTDSVTDHAFAAGYRQAEREFKAAIRALEIE